MYFIAEELREIMAQLGFRTLKEMVGQSQKLNVNKAIKHYKASGLDLSTILYKPEKAKNGTESQYNNTRSRIRERFRFPDYKGGDSFYL
jgi:glutamate synthase (ferredoxin)